MRFSDFEEINDLLEAEYLVGYFGIRNVRISATNLFGSQLIGSGSNGFIPVFSDEKVLESSIIYIDGSNVSIGTTVDTGYKLFVDSGSLADGLYVTSQRTGLKIESTGLNENIVVFSGQEGDVFVIPTNTGASVVSLRKIVHPDATAASESATLGQVNSNIETTAQELQGEINLRVAYEDVGVPLGVAELDANGKIIISQIPDSILGQVSYQGVWNVSTNTPTLDIPPASTTKGDYYIVSGVGTFSGIDFQDGDWIISKGDRWEKVDNTDAVVSVFGRIGAIQAVEADYQAFYPKLSESYVNPTWISSLDWNKITNSPDFLLENQTITLSGDVTGSGKTAISTSISANAVTNEKIRQSAGLSVIGRSVSTSGNVSDITATQEGHVLRRSNGSLSFGLLTDVSISDLSWNKITGTPTTILGYGITDAYTKTETDNIVAGYVPYTGATANVNLGVFGIIANQFSVPGGSANQFLKANGSLDSTSYVPSTRSVSAGTGLTGGGNLSADRTISFDTVFGDNRYLAPLAGYVPYTGATTNVDLGNFRLVADSLKLKPTPNTVPVDQGSLYWDVDDNVIAVVLNGTVQKVGEDSFFAVENKTGSTILKGTNVRFAGTLGASGKLLIAPFIADGSTPSSFYMGVTSEDIPNDGAGKVYQFGRIRGIDTSMYSEGDILYASTTIAGGFQTTVPTAPNNIIQVAAVITSHANVGTIMVRPTIGSNINKDEGVKITSGSTGDILQLQSNGLFENVTKAEYLAGTSSQFVKGDGSLDDTEYVTVPTTQTITGQKTFSLDTKFNGVNVGRGSGSVNTNTALGNSALLNNTTGALNTASGSSALRENTTGEQNSAFGSNSLYSNTTGVANTATGINSLFFNTTGSLNTAVGNTVSFSNTTGSNNTSVGNQALFFNTTGSNNLALGFRAGQSTVIDNNIITNNSIYIGSDTRANGNNETNQIVIGHNAIGQGSNTVTIGNSSITLNRFFGTMRIGTINNGAGDFITTDANGVLTKRTAAETLSDIGGVGIEGTLSPFIIPITNSDGTKLIDTNIGIANATNTIVGINGLAIDSRNTQPLVFRTNDLERWSILTNGTFQSNGAQTIQTSSGNLTLQSNGGNTVLGGALNGTSASFSGNLSLGGAAANVNPLYVKTATDSNLRVTDAAGTLQIAVVNDAVNAHRPFMLGNGWLNFSNTGAATFSSSVTAASATFNGLLSVAAFSTSDLSTSTQISLTRTSSQFSGIAFRGVVTSDAGIFTEPNNDALYIGRHFGGGGAWQKQVTFLPNGNVGIGTTSPNAALDVNDLRINGGVNPSITDGGNLRKTLQWNGANNTFGVFNTNNAGVDFQPNLFINGTGNVGIGTTAPLANLHVRAASGAADVRIQDSSNTTTLYLQSQNGIGVFGTITNHALRFDTNDSEKMRITSAGNVGIGTTSFPNNNYKLVINQGLDRNFAIAEQNGELSLEAFNNAAIASVPMALFASKFSFNNGNVGIGTTAPTSKLEVVGDVKTNGTLTFRALLDNIESLDIRPIASTANFIITNYRGASTSSIQFNSNGTTLINQSGGNVGIGTTAPGQKLSVAGDISAQASTVFADKFENWGSNLVINSGGGLPTVFQTNGTERLRITSTGDVRIGNTTHTLASNRRMTVQGDAGIEAVAIGTTGEPCVEMWQKHTSGDNVFSIFYSDAGSITRGSIDYNRAAGLVRYNATSDKNLKNIIGDSDKSKSIQILNSTRIREYSWKEDKSNKSQIGVIAQELYKTYKGAVSEGSDDELLGTKDYKPWGVDKTAFTFHLVAGFQEHERIIKELQEQIDSLKNQYKNLKQN